jgi:hypothetical protein
MKADEFWEKAFRGTMTVLLGIVISIASAILKSNQEIEVKIARIESVMPKREDIVELQNKVFSNERRILTLELSCRKLSRSL